MNKPDKKIFATLFFSIFATVTGVGIVVPLLPVYAHDLGASGFYIGLIFGVFSISRTICLHYFGRRSDEKGRKPYIVTGLFAYSIISFCFVFQVTVRCMYYLLVDDPFHLVAEAQIAHLAGGPPSIPAL